MSAIVLDFLTNTSGIDIMSAAPLVQKFIAKGAVDSKALFSLSTEEVKELVPNAAHRRKIVAAIRKGEAQAHVALERSPEKRRKGALKANVPGESQEESILPPEEVPENELVGEFSVNRSPVMILWGAVVAYELSHDWGSALSLSHTVAALNAKAKAGRIWGNETKQHDRTCVDGPHVEGIMLLGRVVPACRMMHGAAVGALRGCLDGKAVHPKAPHNRLQAAFPGRSLAAVYTAMRKLAHAIGRAALESDSRRAYAAYERFRPSIPDGASGWGTAGTLSLPLIASLAEELRPRDVNKEKHVTCANVVDPNLTESGSSPCGDAQDVGDIDADVVAMITAGKATRKCIARRFRMPHRCCPHGI
jgi:hypothetical protein